MQIIIITIITQECLFFVNRLFGWKHKYFCSIYFVPVVAVFICQLKKAVVLDEGGEILMSEIKSLMKVFSGINVNDFN